MGERLQRGRKGPEPRPKPAKDAAKFDTWSAADYEEHGRVQRRLHKFVVSRRATRARVRAMPRGRRYLRRGMLAGTWLLGFVAVLMVAVIIAYFEFTDVPRPEDLPLQQVATIQYSDGSTLAKIGTQDRTIVSLDQVPATVRWAVLAAEDRNFYNEGAVSIRGTVRAALSDLGGGNTQGGSGITQQYVKNAYLNNAQTLTRKLKELMIAAKLSREYSKDQILEFYLNTVYLGRGAYGIEAAAQAYFGEDVSKLTTAQGALLAALLRAPSYYDPAQNPTQARLRWRYVLDGMVATKHLTAAQEAKLTFPATRKPAGTGIGVEGWKALVVQAVLSELKAAGISSDEVNERGLIIRTTLDPKAQTAALNAITTTYSHLTAKQRNLKNALVAIQPTSGAVLAYYGGSGPGVKGYDGKVDYNDWAEQRANPPGSTFKPYVLATVLQQTLDQKPGDGQIHYAINSDVDGSYTKIIDGTKIQNDPGDKSVSGPAVTIAHAMRYSLNTAFDYLASVAGPSNVAAMAHALGVARTDSSGNKTLQDSDGVTSFGIGIGDYPVTVMDQASGYATFADNGVHNQPYLVSKVTDSNNNVVYQHKAAPKQVLDPRIANDVTLTLEKVASDAGLGLAGGRMSAAKTGTEGIFSTRAADSQNNSDAWMVGYTPQVSAAVWTGTGLHQPIYNAAGQPEYGSDLSGKAWQAFMDSYLKGMPKQKLATRQLISAEGKTIPKPAPTTSAPAPPSRPVTVPTQPSLGASTSSKASTSAPPTTPASSSYSPPPIPSNPPNPQPTCGPGLLQKPCPTPPAAQPTP